MLLQGGFRVKRIILFCFIMLTMNMFSVHGEELKDMVPETHWAYEALNYVYKNGILQGFEDETLRPNGCLTRAQMAAIVVRMHSDGNCVSVDEFTDVSPKSWYYEYIKEAVGMGLFQGDNNKRMNPDKNISRQEAFVVIGRLLKISPIPGKTDFIDDEKIAQWSKGMIKALYERKYITGDDYFCINADDEMTRAEFSQLIYNISRLTEKQEEAFINNVEKDEEVFDYWEGENKEVSIDDTETNEKGEIGFSDGDSYSSDIFDE